MPSVHKWFVLVAIGALGLVIFGKNASSAPKPTGGAEAAVLQGLFDKSKAYKGAKGKVEKDGSLSFSVPMSKNEDETIYVQELTNGYGWVWTKVAAFDKSPPSGLYRVLAEANDSNRWGCMSWGAAEGGKGGTVYLNFFFLTRTADADALDQYIDTAVSERVRMTKELRDFLP